MLASVADLFVMVTLLLHTTEFGYAIKCMSVPYNSCSCVTDANGWILDLLPHDHQAIGKAPYSVNALNSIYL